MCDETVQKVIDLFGGQSALAGLIAKRQSTVQYWSKSGLIPPKWHSALLSLAQQRGVKLEAKDLIAEPDEPGLEIEDIDGESSDIPVAKWWGSALWAEQNCRATY